MFYCSDGESGKKIKNEPYRIKDDEPDAEENEKTIKIEPSRIKDDEPHTDINNENSQKDTRYLPRDMTLQ